MQFRKTLIEVQLSYEKDLPLTSGYAPKEQQVFMKKLILTTRVAFLHNGALESITESDLDSM